MSLHPSNHPAISPKQDPSKVERQRHMKLVTRVEPSGSLRIFGPFDQAIEITLQLRTPIRRHLVLQVNPKCISALSRVEGRSARRANKSSDWSVAERDEGNTGGLQYRSWLGNEQLPSALRLHRLRERSINRAKQVSREAIIARNALVLKQEQTNASPFQAFMR
jgi:hypothetical protein